ncbi:glucokinase, partial [Thioclava sp. BHET1]
MSSSAQAPSLVADIGGTNTRVALAQGKRLVEGSVRRYSNADVPGLESILRRYLSEEEVGACSGACIAAAGPVHEGVATMTNLDWTIGPDMLRRATGADHVAILNDLQAQGHALGAIAGDKLRQVIALPEDTAPAPEHATKLVIGVGTGFNAAPVHETASGRLVAASECGHISMPVRTETDLR